MAQICNIFILCILSISLNNLIAIQHDQTRQKRAINTVQEYLESINSLRFKKQEILKELQAEALNNPQNSIKIKIWIKKKLNSIGSDVACSPKAHIWSDVDLYSYNTYPIESSFVKNQLYYCDTRTNGQNQALSNIYQTSLVFSNSEYILNKFLGSKMVEKVQINFRCNKNLFINNICLGYNEFKWETEEITSKSFCIDKDIINYCFMGTYTRMNFTEKGDYSLMLSNLDELSQGLKKIKKNSYDKDIDLICDNIKLKLVDTNADCKCQGTEWVKQKVSNNNVFFVGFEPETKEILIDPGKCTERINN